MFSVNVLEQKETFEYSKLEHNIWYAIPVADRESLWKTNTLLAGVVAIKIMTITDGTKKTVHVLMLESNTRVRIVTARHFCLFADNSRRYHEVIACRFDLTI